MQNLETISAIVKYYNENESTVRETAKHFGISKSSVYHYLTTVMPNKVSAEILKKNKEERHIRGGQATKNKYLKKNES